jgi:NADH:ubiquinone oxidoreductase subunit E
MKPINTVTVCVGSSCHVKGSRKLITSFSQLLKDYGLEDQVELKGCFCMERCGKGVNWQIDDTPVTSASPEEAVQMFRERIIEPIAGAQAPRAAPPGGA